MMSGFILSEDVTVIIMSRLPVKSLLRFKSVCKSWYSLIKSPVFISEHLQHQHSLNDIANAPLFVVSDNLLNDYRVSWTTSSKNIDIDVPNKRTGRTVLGPVNGIYCTIEVIKRDFSMVLFNPALRESKALDMTHTRIFKILFHQYFKHNYGFGYDSKTNDFKVVHVSLHIDEVKLHVIHRYVFVYTLSSNSWREIDTDDYKGSFGFLNDYSVFLGHDAEVNIINWSGVDDDGPITLSFNLETEKFTKQKLAYPSIIDHRTTITSLLYAYRDSIDGVVLKLHGSVYKEIRYDIRVMKEYGVEDSWDKLYNTDSFPPGVDGLITLYNVSKNDEVVFDRYSKSSQLEVCDRGSCQAIARPDIYDVINVVSYMESLISIN